MARTVYRIVLTNPPTLMDFTSNAAKGRILRDATPELLKRWSGISVWDTEGRARRQAGALARRGRRLGDFIAELRIDESVLCERSFRSGHFTLWEEPAVLLDCVARVVDI